MTAYREIYDESGMLRPAYAAMQARTGTSVTNPPEPVAAELRSGVVGGRPVYPVPLVLAEEEHQSVIAPGVLQRAFTLQALFEDLVLGRGKIFQRGLLGGNEIELILRSEGTSLGELRRLWKGQSRDQIRFVYAPDLIRSPGGEWLALEDNIGCVGGIAQAPATLDAYLHATGLQAWFFYGPADLHRAVRAFLDRAGLAPGAGDLYGFPGWVSQCGTEPNDFETRWKTGCLRSFGIVSTEPRKLLDDVRGGARLAAIVNLSATLTPAYRELAEVVFAGSGVPVMGAPGVGVAGSKSFLPLDEALAAEYLGEQLLIRSVPARLLREDLDPLPESGVLKRSNGCQGTEVHFLDEVRGDPDKKALLSAVRAWGPCAAILQETVERSVLADGTPIEVRPIVYVYGWRAALVGEVVSGRAITPSQRRGNTGRGAWSLPVLRETTG